MGRALAFAFFSLKNPRFAGTRSIAASTIAVQIFVLPALLYLTGVLSFLSLPANILALPIIPSAMLAGFLAGLLAMVHPILALLPALVGTALLQWMISIVTITAAIPFSATTVVAFPAWLMALVYIPLTWFAIRTYRNYRVS